MLHNKVQREGIDKDPALFEAGLLTLNDYVCLSKRLRPMGGGPAVYAFAKIINGEIMVRLPANIEHLI